MNTRVNHLERKFHHGQSLQFFRLLRNLKQEALADGAGLSQSALSRLEMQERIDDGILLKMAGELDVPMEAIKYFDREKAVSIVLGMTPGDATSDLQAPPTHAVQTAEEYPCLLARIEKLEKSLVSQQEFYELLLKEKEERFRCMKQLIRQLKKG
ncbi:MAG: helix-turn-helix domain-containing protein [Dysgonamonadaceae bacterium]|nr:helix-turn-helix domain-containing protein [Dysgonamonadaceae bacterium]